jgi:hypothetical protein
MLLEILGDTLCPGSFGYSWEWREIFSTLCLQVKIGQYLIYLNSIYLQIFEMIQYAYAFNNEDEWLRLPFPHLCFLDCIESYFLAALSSRGTDIAQQQHVFWVWDVEEISHPHPQASPSPLVVSFPPSSPFLLSLGTPGFVLSVSLKLDREERTWHGDSSWEKRLILHFYF